MSKYRSTWHLLPEQTSENLEEFTQVFVVRYRDPLNKKRFAVPYKDQKSADDKMAQLKRDGVKEIEVTKDMLRGNIKFKEVAEDTDQERLATLRTRQMMLQTKVRDMDQGDPKTKTPMAIAKNDIENIGMKMDQIKDKIKRQSMREDSETKEFEKDLVAQAEKPLSTKGATRKPTSKSDKLYLNNPKEFRRRNELENAYKQILNTLSDKEKNSKEGKIKAMDLARVRSAKSKEDLAKNMKHKGTLKIAETDLTKGQIKKVHKMADELPKKDFKDRYGKEKGDSVRYATATNMVKKKEGIKEMQQIDEKIEGIKNKSEKSGIPYGILKQVYNRGMAAWKGGHRPGTTPQQWAFARVNAFITKGKAYYTADADLAKKARAAKKGKK